MTWVLVIFFVQGWNSASVTNIPGYKSGEACYKAEKEILGFLSKDRYLNSVNAYCISGPAL